MVEKRREIYFVEVADVSLPDDPSAAERARSRENVKVHLDTVSGLGSFVEIEAIDLDGSLGPALLDAQCRRLMARLAIAESDLVAASYSDLLLPGATAVGLHRVDLTNTWTTTVGYRLGKGPRVGFGTVYRQRQSNNANYRDYDGFRFTSTIDYDF